jgi:hypothetical protein
MVKVIGAFDKKVIKKLKRKVRPARSPRHNVADYNTPKPEEKPYTGDVNKRLCKKVVETESKKVKFSRKDFKELNLKKLKDIPNANYTGDVSKTQLQLIKRGIKDNPSMNLKKYLPMFKNILVEKFKKELKAAFNEPDPIVLDDADIKRIIKNLLTNNNLNYKDIQRLEKLWD